MATIGILSERVIRRGEILTEQLQAALNSRVTIEQAEGVVAQSLGVGMDAAFERLRHHSRTTHQRLSEVARQVVDGRVDTGALTPAPAEPPAR